MPRAAARDPGAGGARLGPLTPPRTPAPFRYVRNLTSSKESWVPASSLWALLGSAGSARCLSSSGKPPAPRPAARSPGARGRSRGRSPSRLVFPQSPAQGPRC